MGSSRVGAHEFTMVNFWSASDTIPVGKSLMAPLRAVDNKRGINHEHNT